MKEITLRVTDEMAQLVEQWAEHIPNMEVVDTGDCLDDDNRDLCFRQAIMELKAEGVLRRPCDYAWIMVAIDQFVVDEIEAFNSSRAFVGYLGELGIDDLPHHSTLTRNSHCVEGIYPDWEFSDTDEHQEVLRRRNVVKRFLAAYNRAKRRNASSNATIES